jgi:hypothetical protein
VAGRRQLQRSLVLGGALFAGIHLPCDPDLVLAVRELGGSERAALDAGHRLSVA